MENAWNICYTATYRTASRRQHHEKTRTDYAQLISALANGGVGPNGNRILADCTIELMRTDALSPELKKDFSWDSMPGYNYGLGVRTMVVRIAGGSLSGIGEFGWIAEKIESMKC